MNTLSMTKVSLGIGRILSTALLVFSVGFLGLAHVFSDLGPGETEAQRMAKMLLTYVIGPVFIGVLVPRHWWVAGLSVWGPVSLYLVALPGHIRAGTVLRVWQSLALVFILLPVLWLLSGWAGARIRHRHVARRFTGMGMTQ